MLFSLRTTRFLNFKLDQTFVTYTQIMSIENCGNGFNIGTGLLTAPMKGVYFFSFSSVNMKAIWYDQNENPNSSLMVVFINRMVGKILRMR